MIKKRILVIFSVVVLVFCLSTATALACCMIDCCCKPPKGKILIGFGCACDGGTPVFKFCYYL